MQLLASVLYVSIMYILLQCIVVCDKKKGRLLLALETFCVSCKARLGKKEAVVIVCCNKINYLCIHNVKVWNIVTKFGKYVGDVVTDLLNSGNG